MVIIVTVADYDLARIFMDICSSSDIFFLDCFKKICLDTKLLPMETTLYGFTGGLVQPLAQVALPVAVGAEPVRKIKIVNFLVVDIPSFYNSIIGKPMINLF